MSYPEVRVDRTRFFDNLQNNVTGPETALMYLYHRSHL